MELIHFSHRHSLALSAQRNDEVCCFGCRLPIAGGPAYACSSCKYFIHKSCGDLPQQIDDHPFHPQHPLTLGRAPHRSGKFYCKACRDLCAGFVFHCSQCDFGIDIVCARLMPSTHIGENQEQEIEHFSHPHHQHPLIPVICCQDQYYKIKCSVCDQAIKGLIYVCFGCQFFIHKSCSELPLQIRHPFHPQHELTLHAKKPGDRFFSGFVCHVCFKLSCGFVYHCPKCGFNLDILCSRLKPNTQEGNHEEQQIKHFSHWHQLTLVPCVEEDMIYNIACSACSMDVKHSDGSIYVCFDCKYFIHKSCADQLPMEIQDHPFHPQHSFTLGVIPEDCGNTCSVCHEKMPTAGLFYFCSDSDFFVDVTCAMLLPTAGNEQLGRQSIQHHSHPHPLIPFDEKTRLLICFGCEGILTGSSYVCPQCIVFLCRSCAQLPEKIKHSFHPQHPITFLPDSRNKEYFCIACRKRHVGFVYHCAACQFYMGLKCASLPTVKYERHEHPLAFIDEYELPEGPLHFTNEYGRRLLYIDKSDLGCHSCSFPCRRSFLRCVLCDLNLHIECIPPLPRIVKYGTHRHWLTLTDPLLEDGKDKYYCNACEGERNSKHSFYSCAECEFVAEIECGLKSEEVNSIQEESLVVRQLLDAGLDVFDYCFSNEKEEKDEGTEDEEADSDNDSVDSSKLDGWIEEVRRGLKALLREKARHEAKRRRALNQAS